MRRKVIELLRELVALLKELIALLKVGPAVSADILIGKPKESAMAKKFPNRIVLDSKAKKASGANPSWSDFQKAGVSLVTRDKNGLVAAPIDPTLTTVAWASVPPGVITFATLPATPNDTTNEIGTNTNPGPLTGVVLTATFTNLDGSPPLPMATSSPFDVPAVVPGAPVSVDIVIGTPA